MKYGLVSVAIAVLAVATAASVLVVGRPVDQSGQRMHEAPITVRADQAVAAPTSAVAPPPASGGSDPVVPAVPAAPVAPAPADPAPSAAPATGSADADESPAAAPVTTPSTPAAPVAVAPAPAQPVPPADGGKHKGAAKGGAGDKR